METIPFQHRESTSPEGEVPTVRDAIRTGQDEIRYPAWVKLGPTIVSQCGDFYIVHRGLRPRYRQGV